MMQHREQMVRSHFADVGVVYSVTVFYVLYTPQRSNRNTKNCGHDFFFYKHPGCNWEFVFFKLSSSQMQSFLGRI